MISKERLEELIEEKAKVYFIYNESFIAGYSSIAKIKELDLSDFKPIYFTSSNIENDFVAIKNTSLTVDRNDFENLFETEEDARWELEMTETRTETLKLPTWEEAKSINGFIAEFSSPTAKELFTFFIKIDYNHNIKINKYYRGNGEHFDVFEKPPTKENYIEACKLCLKLFGGEKV